MILIMRNDTGIFNSQSPTNDYLRSLRGLSIGSLPVRRGAQIENLEQLIPAIENLRAFKFAIGNMPEAKLHAIRLGTIRSQLRQLKAGK